jgi:mono/diheme cytochrome c family protein
MRFVLIAAGVLFASSAFADEGAARFDAAGCRACHRIGARGGESGPDLTVVGHRRSRAWIENWLKSPRAWKPDTKMPEQGLSDADRGALADFLSGQKGQAWDGSRPWPGPPRMPLLASELLQKGRSIYIHTGCIACHGVSGKGGHPNPGAHGDIIPALAPLMGTYTADELKAKINDGVIPDGHDGMTPAVVMPAWKNILSDDEVSALTKYLLSLAESQPKSDW